MELKVLHFLGSGKIGGQEKAQYQLLKSLNNEKDISIGVAVGRMEGILIEKIRTLNIPIISLDIKSGFSLRFRNDILKEFKEYQIHHFHDSSPNNILYSLIAGKNIKRVFTRRGGIFSYPLFDIKKKLKFRIKKLLLKKTFNGFSGNSKIAVRSMKEQFGINKKIHLLYNGIDFTSLEPSEKKGSMLKKIGLNGNNFIIGTACKLVKLKRVDLLIRAFSKANISGKKLIVLGKGPEIGNLKKLATSLNLSNDITFLGEVINVSDYLQLFNTFVLASNERESFGNALIEAVYFKIPTVIMNDSPGLKEHIAHNSTGYIANDENHLASLMEHIYQHPGEAECIGEHACSYVTSKYSVENMVKAYKAFYMEILYNPP